jgi:hypothetical protein
VRQIERIPDENIADLQGFIKIRPVYNNMRCFGPYINQVPAKSCPFIEAISSPGFGKKQ